ncbi:hypothetical protein IWQ57_006512, partial [Coemansia nantahalensis]
PYTVPTPSAHAAELRASDEAAQHQFGASWAMWNEIDERMDLVEEAVMKLFNECTAAENALAAATRALAAAPSPADAPMGTKSCRTSTVSTTGSNETLVEAGQAHRTDALADALAAAKAATRAQEERTAHLEAEIEQVRRYLRWSWLPQLRCVHRKQTDVLLDVTHAAYELFFDAWDELQALRQPL